MFNFAQFLNNPEVNFSVQLRCFSAPFFQKYDRVKVNELNYGGKVDLLTNKLIQKIIQLSDSASTILSGHTDSP
jgi:hypothetical protein